MKPSRCLRGAGVWGACLGVVGAAAAPCDAPIVLPEGPGAFGAVSADFDGDGLKDIASVVPEGVAVARNAGALGFSAPVLTAVRPLGASARPVPAYLAAADVDGDGVLDLVLASHAPHCGVDVLLGYGDGTFRASGRFNVVHEGELYEEDYAYRCTGLITSDLNHDGRDDVIVSHVRADFDQHFGYDVFLADAVGYLDPPVFSALDGLGPMVSGDMNGDGELDLVVASSTCERGCWDMTSRLRVEVHFGDGSGSFASPVFTPVPVAPESLVLGVAVGSFDANPALDVALLDTGGCCIDEFETALGPQRWLLLGAGDGSFELGDTAPCPASGSIGRNRLISVDVDADGQDDLVADAATDLLLERGLGGGRFASRVLATGYVEPTQVLFEDVGGDGVTDLLTVAADTGAPSAQPLP